MLNPNIKLYNGLSYTEIANSPDWINFISPLNKTPIWTGMVFENCRLFREFIYDFKTCPWKYLLLSSAYLKNVRKKCTSPIINRLIEQIDAELNNRYERKEVIVTCIRNPKYVEWYLRKTRRMRSLRTPGSSLSEFKNCKKHVEHLRMKKRR